MWIKLWDRYLDGTQRELKPDERAVFIGLLLVAARSENPGVAQAAPGVPWTDAQLARLLVVSKQLLRRAMKRLAETDRITVDDRGLLHVVNWSRYQSESLRVMSSRREGRLRPDVVTKVTAKVTPKVTAGVTPPDRDSRLRRSPPPPSPPPSAHKARKTERKGWAAQSTGNLPG